MAYYEHIVTLHSNEVKCTLCDLILINSDRFLEAHVQGRKHRELSLKTLMRTNNIIGSASNLYCLICDSKISESLITHLQLPNHQSKINSIRHLASLDGELIVLPNKISNRSRAYCIACNRDVEFTYASLKDHIISMIHKQARAMVLQPLNGIFSVEGSDEFLWCKICQIFFDNYVELIFQHIEESGHAMKIDKILRVIDGQHIEIHNYLQNNKEDKALCKKCDMEVPCNVDNLEKHINGKKHKTS